MDYKRFTQTFYLYDGKMVQGCKDFTQMNQNPEKTIMHVIDLGADEISFCFLSETQEGLQKDLAFFQEYGHLCTVPCTISVKKPSELYLQNLLDAGADRIALKIVDASDIQHAKALIFSFGKDKIVGVIEKANFSDYAFEEFVQLFDEIVCVSTETANLFLQNSTLKLNLYCNDLPLNYLLRYLSNDRITGISGPFVHSNLENLATIKTFCRENRIPVRFLNPRLPWSALKKNSDGMVPVIVQDYENNDVLMLAYMNQESYEHTLKTGKMTYFSRSRQELWIKGDTSGHYQYVKSLKADCDLDTILAKVSQVGAACHTGRRNCFFEDIADSEDWG